MGLQRCGAEGEIQLHVSKGRKDHVIAIQTNGATS
jgi:hypothetical protein